MPAKPAPRNRGQIIQKGDGRWLVRFYAGRDAEGKRQYPAKLVEGTYKQAEKELTKMLRESDTGTFVPASKQSLKDYCTLWLDGKVGLSAKTKRDYILRLEKDVYPVLGTVKLDQVSSRARRSRAFRARCGRECPRPACRGPGGVASNRAQ